MLNKDKPVIYDKGWHNAPKVIVELRKEFNYDQPILVVVHSRTLIEEMKKRFGFKEVFSVDEVLPPIGVISQWNFREAYNCVLVVLSSTILKNNKTLTYGRIRNSKVPKYLITDQLPCVNMYCIFNALGIAKKVFGTFQDFAKKYLIEVSRYKDTSYVFNNAKQDEFLEVIRPYLQKTEFTFTIIPIEEDDSAYDVVRRSRH